MVILWHAISHHNLGLLNQNSAKLLVDIYYCWRVFLVRAAILPLGLAPTARLTFGIDFFQYQFHFFLICVLCSFD